MRPKKSRQTTRVPGAKSKGENGRIRYAVVGLGNISQVAILPGFLNAKANSELTALVSDDPIKLKKLAKLYKVKNCYDYKQYDECLKSGEIDAVYIALPNNMHREYTLRAADAGIHVLCEKPLAIDERECRDMIRRCDQRGVKLMTAYRLHFERANLEAIKIVQSGKIGAPRYFLSTFSMQTKDHGIRTRKDTGGGPLYDVGIYCINAARYLFQADPYQAFAFSTRGFDKRFKEVDEMTTACLRFPDKRFATFTCSFGAAPTARYEVMGTKGILRMQHGYEYSKPIQMEIEIGKKIIRRSFAKRDQFGPELIYFSNCILHDRRPEPSGAEGLRDIHIVRSLRQSAISGRAVRLDAIPKHRRPNLRLEKHLSVRKPLGLVHTEKPHKS